uniref:Uncharacterized protein n=1 Tax=Panagrolaimus davidi TaxID=227884 RepID=A0A914QKB9_9BILA
MKKGRKCIELIGFDDKNFLQHFDKCKITINCIKELLIVESFNQELDSIKALFKWEYLPKKNILFIFAENNHQSFALIFNSEKQCQKVYNIIHKNKSKSIIPKEKLYYQFLLLMIQRLANEGDKDTEKCLRKLLFQWICKHEKEEEKNEFKKLLKENGVYDQVFARKIFIKDNNATFTTDDNVKSGNNKENQTNQTNTRKRKHFSPDNSHTHKESLRKNKSMEKQPSIQFTKIIKYPTFKLVNSQPKIFRKLIIFTSDNLQQCYEYGWSNMKNMFVCSGCRNKRKRNSAIIDYDKNGNAYVKMEKATHVCKILKYIPENYSEISVLKKPNYEIFENPGGKRRMLFIFNSTDKNLCYEYSYDSRFKKFLCKGCIPKRCLAILCHEGTENECIELENNEHICEKRKYEPEKYSQYHDFILSENFEISTKLKNGEEKKCLIIFDKTNKNLCYTYYYSAKANIYVCNGCAAKNHRTFAKPFKNAEGEEYIRLSNVEHVCELQPYQPKKQIIIQSSNFEIMENTKTGIPKIFVFTDSKDRKFCYVYTVCAKEKDKNRFNCASCISVAGKQKNKKAPGSLYLCKDESGNPYLRTTDQKHICKPRKYNPKKYEASEKCFDFFLFRSKNEPKLLKAAIFHPSNKELCYEMVYYEKCRTTFVCKVCEATSKYKKYVSCKMFKDENGKEYFEHDFTKHICKPLNASKIKASGIEILEFSGLFDKAEHEIDESKIIRSSNFELRPNKSGVLDGKLLLFDSSDKTLCYEYGYNKQGKRYKCLKCKQLNLYVTAKLFEDKNGEKCITLNDKEHQCKPEKYEAEKFVDQTSNFIVFKSNEKTTAKLVIFTSDKKDFCYEYTFCNHDKLFKCYECSLQRKLLFAKICKNDKNEEIAILMRNDHICIPKKFIKEKFIPTRIPASEFVLHSGNDGQPDKRLIIFDSNDKTLAFEYIWRSKRNFFQCLLCAAQNVTVFAKPIEIENSQKMIELSLDKHVCIPQKYDPENYKSQEKLYENFILQYNGAGEADHKLVVFNPENKHLAYEYSFHKQTQKFVCRGCVLLTKFATAKIGNEKQFVEFNNIKHECEIRNLKERNLIFNEFKQETNENGNPAVKVQKDKTNFYKFKYDDDHKILCCVKCKELKKFITATICKNYDGNDFLLLNEKHVCTPFKK